MAEIIPAILPKNFKDLEEKLDRIARFTPIVQIDVCDGVFTRVASWPYGAHHAESFDPLRNQEEGFPHWHDLDFEIDLMVAFPEEVVEDWVNAGAQRLIFHLESNKNVLDAILTAKDFDVETGIAIGRGTKLEQLEPFMEHIDVIQFMGIRTIGMQGQPFDEGVLPVIREVKERYPNCLISVDGGVNLDTARPLIEAGAGRLVVGSALFNSTDIEEELTALRSIA